MTVVSHTTALSVLGAGLALRGPDGSMMTATDGLYEERNNVFQIFGFGLACTVGSVVMGVWLLLSWEAALVCMVVSIFTCRTIWKNYQRVQQRFAFDESDTVDFRDIMEGPAAIQAIPWRMANQTMHPGKKSSSMPLELEDYGPYSDLDIRMALLHQDGGNMHHRKGTNKPSNQSKSKSKPKVSEQEYTIQTI